MEILTNIFSWTFPILQKILVNHLKIVRQKGMLKFYSKYVVWGKGGGQATLSFLK